MHVASPFPMAQPSDRNALTPAAEVKKVEPEKARKAPTATLPGFVVSALSAFDRNLAAVIPDLGTRPTADSAYVTDLTGVRFRSPGEAAATTAKSLARLGVV
jgi:dihydroflavonol-4-reductase